VSNPNDKELIQKGLIVTRHGMSYLDVKYNLLFFYLQYLAIYLLYKLEGKNLDGHPLIERLCKIKLLLEKMRPLD